MKKIILGMFIIFNFLLGNEISIEDLDFKNNRYYEKNSEKLFNGEAFSRSSNFIEVDQIKDGIKISGKKNRIYDNFLVSEFTFDVNKVFLEKVIYKFDGSYNVSKLMSDKSMNEEYYSNKKIKESHTFTKIKLDKEKIIECVNSPQQKIRFGDQKYIYQYNSYDMEENLMLDYTKDYINNKEIRIEDGIKTEKSKNENKVYYEDGTLKEINGTLYNEDKTILETENFWALESDALEEILSEEFEYLQNGNPYWNKEKIISSTEGDLPFLNEKFITKELILKNDRAVYKIQGYEENYIVEVLINSTLSSPDKYRVIAFNKIKKYDDRGKLIFDKDYKIENNKIIFTKNKYHKNGKVKYSIKEEFNLDDIKRTIATFQRDKKLDREGQLELFIDSNETQAKNNGKIINSNKYCKINLDYEIEEYETNGKLKYKGIFTQDRLFNEYYVDNRVVSSREKIKEDKMIKEIEKVYFKSGNIRNERITYYDLKGNEYQNIKKEYNPKGSLIKEYLQNRDIRERKEYFDNGAMKKHLSDKNDVDYLYEGYYRNGKVYFKMESLNYKTRTLNIYNSDESLREKQLIYYDENWNEIRRENI
ncbi:MULTISPECIES: hypothetical protein [Fusobacterium]|uniref:hypothetical protein n=1 Tax=Fusobacterium TaxID=848 RepID=UPI00147782A7|nr:MULTISPECIES: hypothetical protein [Fusobacterium]NME35175.1 hypothetical protein [Fusobacterium sp. FSA-380-WT-3A]